jgi:hypothetical protein
VPALLALLVTQEAHAGEALVALARGTGGSFLGQTLAKLATTIGLFDAIGLGAKSDPEINAKLDQIIADLQNIQTDIAGLQSDYTQLASNLALDTDKTGFATLAQSMSAARIAISNCLAGVEQFASAPGTDASDKFLREYAVEITQPSNTSSDCSTLMDNFDAIDLAITGDLTLGGSDEGAYTLLARILKEAAIHPKGSVSVSFENLANHFVQYTLIQRQALELIRNAFTVLGEQAALTNALTKPPHNFLQKLTNEEVAFLKATDAYIAYGSPSDMDPSPAQLADAIVQRLEGVKGQVTTYGLSILDTATPFVPQVQPLGGAVLAMTDKLGDSYSYYDIGDVAVNDGIGTCRDASNDGFLYLRPNGATEGGFAIATSCSVHVERHLQRDVTPPASQQWSIYGRWDSSPHSLTFARLNAATLTPEGEADAYALAGDPGGPSSGASAFTIVADKIDPRLVTLSIDLPSQAGVPIMAGYDHAFVAGTGPGSASRFYKEPAGPDFPDRYALSLNGKYLSVGSNGFAALADSRTYFDFRAQPDGKTTQLEYDGGVLYVDDQFIQGFYGETPDVFLAKPVDILNDYPNYWNNELTGLASPPFSLYPPCLDQYSNPILHYGPKCSAGAGGYKMYVATMANLDTTNQRRFKFAYTGQVEWSDQTDMSGGIVYNPHQVGGIHCYGDDPHQQFDAALASMSSGDPPVPLSVPGTGTEWTLTIPAGQTLNVTCQALDDANPTNDHAAYVEMDTFTVTPCTNLSGACTPYEP